MDSISKLLQIHEVALSVLKAGGVDCQAYDIWRNECGGQQKLRVLAVVTPLLPMESPAQRYAEVLLGQMTELLAQGCSDELLMATYEYCDGVFDAVKEAIDEDSLSGANVSGAETAAGAEQPPMAMAA